MPGLFIDVKLQEAAARDVALGRKLEDVCPVDIFKASENGVEIVEDNLDECVLCDLCTEAAPGQVQVIRLYEE